MKTYPLKVVADWAWNERVYMSRGHHDPEAFIKAVREFGVSRPLKQPGTTMLRLIRPKGLRGLLSYLVPGYCSRFPATYVYEQLQCSDQPSTSTQFKDEQVVASVDIELPAVEWNKS